MPSRCSREHTGKRHLEHLVGSMTSGLFNRSEAMNFWRSSHFFPATSARASPITSRMPGMLPR